MRHPSKRKPEIQTQCDACGTLSPLNPDVISTGLTCSHWPHTHWTHSTSRFQSSPAMQVANSRSFDSFARRCLYVTSGSHISRLPLRRSNTVENRQIVPPPEAPRHHQPHSIPPHIQVPGARLHWPLRMLIWKSLCTGGTELTGQINNAEY